MGFVCKLSPTLLMLLFFLLLSFDKICVLVTGVSNFY